MCLICALVWGCAAGKDIVTHPTCSQKKPTVFRKKTNRVHKKNQPCSQKKPTVFTKKTNRVHKKKTNRVSKKKPTDHEKKPTGFMKKNQPLIFKKTNRLCILIKFCWGWIYMLQKKKCQNTDLVKIWNSFRIFQNVFHFDHFETNIWMYFQSGEIKSIHLQEKNDFRKII